MEWWIVALIGVQLAFVAFLLWLAASYRQRSLERRSAERLRVLERISSGQELSDFLATDSGRRFLELFAVKTPSPAGLIVTGIVLGIVAAAVGGGFVVLSTIGDQGFVIPAAILLAAALGVLAATLVSSLLARKYGLLSPPGDLAPRPDIESAVEPPPGRRA